MTAVHLQVLYRNTNGFVKPDRFFLSVLWSMFVNTGSFRLGNPDLKNIRHGQARGAKRSPNLFYNRSGKNPQN